MPTTATSDVLPGYRVDPVTGAWLTIPWPSDQAEKDALLASSLGPDLIRWAEGDGDEPGLTDYLSGRPWRFTPGQKRFLILWYAFDERGRWLFRSGAKRGAKGTGKDPFGAALCNIELVGKSQLVLNEDTGLYEGMRHMMPLVQIMSNSEAQSKDMLRVANALFGQEARDYFAIDTGETRTILKDGGRLEVLTASESSAEGDPATFIALNESHHMTESSGGHRIAEVARRNVGKSPAALQARLCEFTNAHRMGTDSVAERTFNAWQAQVSGRAKRMDILYDSIEANPATRLHVESELQAGLAAAYSDAPWADLERLADEVLDPRTTPGDSIRFYLNGLAAAEDAWVDPRKFDALADTSLSLVEGDQVAVFLDCSKSEDATGVVACRLSDGAVFVLGVWQKPHGDRGKSWLVPRDEVDGVIRNAFAKYRVEWCGIDPSPATDDADESLYWKPMIDDLHRDFARKLKVWATPGAQGNAVLFDMRTSQAGALKRNQLFTEVAMLTAKEIDGESPPFHHDGNSALRVHTHNAKRRPNQWGYSIGKASRDSHQLVDLAVCMVGARMGRGLVLNSGKVRKRRPSGTASTRRVLVMG